MSDRNTSGQVERVGHSDEVRRLVGGVCVDRPGEHLRLVGHERDRFAAEAGQSADHGGSEAGLYLQPVVAVDNDVDHGPHVVGLAVVPGHELGQFRGGRGPVASSPAPPGGG